MPRRVLQTKSFRAGRGLPHRISEGRLDFTKPLPSLSDDVIRKQGKVFSTLFDACLKDGRAVTEATRSHSDGRMLWGVLYQNACILSSRVRLMPAQPVFTL